MLRPGPRTLLPGVALALAVFAVVPDARVAAHDGAHDEIELTTRALVEHPRDVMVRLRRAELRRISGDWPGAAADLAAARAFAPGRPEVDLCAAALEFDRGALAEALAAVDRHLAARPGNPDALRLRARIRLAAGEPAGAVADLDQALAASRPTPDHYRDRAAAQRAAGVPPERILAGLDEGMRRLGCIVSLALPAIEIEQSLGRHDAALARLEPLAATRVSRGMLLERRAEILTGAGRAREARMAYAAALAEIESMPSARRNLPAVREMEARVHRALAAPGTTPSHPPSQVNPGGTP